MRKQFAEDLKNDDIDRIVFDRLIRELNQVQKVCDAGDEKRAQALLIQVTIDEQLGGDESYRRKVNSNNVGG